MTHHSILQFLIELKCSYYVPSTVERCSMVHSIASWLPGCYPDVFLFFFVLFCFVFLIMEHTLS